MEVMTNGAEVTPHGVAQLEVGLDSFTGYSIGNAETTDEALELASTNPMISSVVVYELARM